MSFVKDILGKELYDLQIDDIVDFFKEPKSESSRIEFKTGDVELEKLYSEISAFLNTEGGLLIVGTPKEEKNTKENYCQGELIPSTKIKSVDDLSRSIASNISPSPVGIKIHSLPYKQGLIFIIYTPQSHFPPHQDNRQGKYYIRFERECKPAPHGIIEALFNRRQRPEIDANIDLSQDTKDQGVKLQYQIFNNSSITGECLFCHVEVFGIAKVLDKTNILSEFKLEQDVLTYQKFNTEIFLVKGMSFPIVLTFVPSCGMVIACISFYCKDTEIGHKICVFENETLVADCDSKKEDEPNVWDFLDKWKLVFAERNN